EAHRIARAQSASKAGGMFVVATAGVDEIDAALAGYAKALARERGDELVKSVELRTGDGADALAHALLAELRSGNAAPEVRWAGGTRYEPDMVPAAEGEPVEIGAGDVVLITGGTRGIGLKLAQALSAKGASVALAGRTPPAQLPERAVFVQWDVTRPPGAALARKRPAVRALSLEYPPWDGTAMVAKIPPLARAALAEQGVPFIDDAAGLAAFFGALRGGWSGPVLLAHDRPGRRIAHRLR